MSGFDENPFGEPNVNDPFSDPAVRKAASSIPNRGMEDYNPFVDTSGGTGTQVRGASNPPIYGGTSTTSAQQPAMLQTSSQEAPPPNYSRSPQQTIPSSSSGIFSPTSQPPNNEAWKRNEQDMSNTPYYPRRNNWPPLSDKCCVQPCFYQDIDVEIKTDFQKIVRQLYYLWMFHGLVLILNVIGGFAMMLAYGYFTTFGLGILYLILFTPFSFICWFRPAYQAFKDDSSFNFMVFFFVFFFQVVVTVVQSIGIPGCGTCGIITAISSFHSTTKDMFVGCLLLLIAGAFIVAATGDIVLLSKVHRIYRSSGSSFSKAQDEFTTTFFGSEHVQNAASNVAASAVRAQVNNMTQPRY
ncbi:PREDICTED: secretory carrier-associated membrane protein 5 [Ceratosolen solmsi marchali]|uniref:Secretory carrier-associated membrane protein n=1 Tax=Ceratosolen solmsi marchali TaxID=326594 RepID=A0AAJ6YV19_9HYME|nr:PREDICTED: secretory carrier-associated membrane protein 5 [Ceratosolen solmsi marchali]XP_011504875.1 PREDICTED: secretory carrier-associated membrane protein 5 [Ceratosolen solmsi marchali]XP_011504876.1 PREDICTED: secretory carrier-associated membrane protein 5 [Ceratosolen solmsi marchali]